MGDRLDEWHRKRRNLLEIDNPGARCGDCMFSNELSGEWSVEDGRLVFRADPSPLQTRGPDFHHCAEGRDEVAEFTRITVNGRELAPEQVAELQATEHAAEEAQYAHWEAERG